MESQSRTHEHQGCHFSYRVTGQGPPLLLIQGVGVQGDAWRPQFEALGQRFRCLTFDHRGLGGSQPRGARVSVDQLARDVVALLDAEGWASAHVVGHSLGGVVAQALALAARERVQSLSLLCTVARGRDASPLTPSTLWTHLRTFVGTRAQRRRAFLEIVLPPARVASATKSELAELAEQLAVPFGHDLAVQPPVAFQQLSALRAHDNTPRLHELAGLATLVVSAEHDCIAPPRLGRALAAAVPGSRHVEIEGAAHGVPLTHPERVNALLHEHLAAAGRRL